MKTYVSDIPSKTQKRRTFALGLFLLWVAIVGIASVGFWISPFVGVFGACVVCVILTLTSTVALGAVSNLL